MDSSQLFMNTTNIWKCHSSLFFRYSWKVSGFLKDKREKEKENFKRCHIKWTNFRTLLDVKIEIMHFKNYSNRYLPYSKKKQNMNFRRQRTQKYKCCSSDFFGGETKQVKDKIKSKSNPQINKNTTRAENQTLKHKVWPWVIHCTLARFWIYRPIV